MWCVSEMTPTSGIEFLVWLLIVAAIIAMLAKRLRIPYTVSLVNDSQEQAAQDLSQSFIGSWSAIASGG